MKKLFAIIVASAMVLGMAQCKKKEVIPYNNKAYIITLNVDGSRTHVNPLTGSVTFEDGDEIIVANSGKYVGTLTYSGGCFGGTITGANDSDYLHFYHLGNRDAGALTEGSSTSCSVSIADQTVSIPVISYGVSTMQFSEELLTYTARLENRCALVKFDVTSASEYAGVCIKGMRNKVTVNFSDASFAFTEDNDGKITLPTGSGERWAVLLPQPATPVGEEGSAFSGMFTGTRGYVPEIKADDYLPEGVAVTVETERLPEGALSGAFTINEDGKQVHFAKGNLTYSKNLKNWSFFENQYMRSYKNDLMVGQDYINYSTVEHFGWGCSGFKHGAVNYKPLQTFNNDSYYYAYGDVNKHLNDENCTADCSYNAIDNGGGAYKQWRMFTLAEIQYLLRTRDGAADKCSFATITTSDKSYVGLLILPDDWPDDYDFDYTPGVFNSYGENTYDLAKWTQMEADGALFLASNGRRNLHATVNVGKSGYYWTCDPYSDTEACCLFYSASQGLRDSWTYIRSNGMECRPMIE